MNHLNYQNNQLFIEGVAVATLAEDFGTPCYAYSKACIEQSALGFLSPLSQKNALVCYAVKANSNLSILKLLADLGCGFDIVSGGELARVLAAGGSPNKIIYSGVGKTIAEIKAAIDANIYCFNVESVAELERLNALGLQLNVTIPIALRVNPNVHAKTHPYIATGLEHNKFGIPYSQALATFIKAKNLPALKIRGLGFHIGSQITELAPFLEAIDEILKLANLLLEQQISLEYIDIGGGLGVTYQHENPPLIADYLHAVLAKFTHLPYKLVIEPGRALVAQSGILISKVEYIKKTPNKNFAIIDAGMNDLLRPALYEAWHNVLPATLEPKAQVENFDIVGPVCESGDYLARERQLALKQDDVIAVTTAGAYGFAMSSNYNSRPKAAEILIDGNSAKIIRRRETIEDLFQHEKIES